MPPDERYAACGAERWQTGRQRHRCAHHAAHRLSRETKETQTDRGVLRLVERYRAAAQTETSRHPQSGVDLHLRGSGLQPGAAEKTGPNSICRVMGTWCLRGRRQRSAKRTHIRGRVRCTPENGRKREHQQRDARFFSTLLGDHTVDMATVREWGESEQRNMDNGPEPKETYFSAAPCP